jgi:hypothetical protein
MTHMKPSSSAEQQPVVQLQGCRQRLLILGTLVVLAALIGGFLLISSLTNQPNTNPLLRVVPANQAVVQHVTGVSSSIVQAVGTGGVPDPQNVEIYIQARRMHIHVEFSE